MDEPPEERKTDKIEVPLEALRQINDLCDEFEARLRAGSRPDLSSFLERAPESVRGKLLYELVALSLEDAGTYQSDTRLKELTEAHPELADEIGSAAAALVPGAVTAAYRERASADGSPETPRRKRSRGLKLRCPHCSNHVELLADAPIDSVSCTTCGSDFSLVNRSIETRMAETLEKIGRFELISRLGVGGFGTVWKARDTELDRPVAIKIPRHGQLTSSETEQFFREARAVAQLNHPNIVPIHEVGREGDTVFIVSDLVRGVSLADELSGASFSPREAAELCRTLALALNHAHQAGIVHRDLKPSNVMLNHARLPVLMDFGLAKRDAEEVTMTIDGQIIGTPAYMSPEQAEGRSAWVDKRTDVYSLGVILFELLTNELPYKGNASRQVQARIRDDAPDIRSLNTTLPRDLAAITAKCLERKPGQRYTSAASVAADLDCYLTGRPVVARPVSAIERARRWIVRHPLPATIAGLVLLLAFAGPAAALLIESQRARLADLLDQKDRLIAARVEEQQAASAAAARLREELGLWEGRGDPFSLWPQDDRPAPYRQALASLQEHMELLQFEAGSGKPAVGETNTDAAKRLLAWATIHEALDNTALARNALEESIALLGRAIASDHRTPSHKLALADACFRLAALSETPEARRLRLDEAEAALADVNDSTVNPLVLASQLEVALHAAATVSYDKAADRLKSAEKAKEGLSHAWADDVSSIYDDACALAGRTPFLSRAFSKVD